MEEGRAREKVVGAFVEALEGGRSLDIAQDALLEAAPARASGLWALSGGALRLIGFRAVPDMPPPVAAEFAAATARVPLSRTDLGIVKAAVSRAPAVAALDPDHDAPGGLAGSAVWLRRFGARQSLALPVLRGDRAVGVIAISSAESFGPGSGPWTLLEEIAGAIAPSLAARAAGGSSPGGSGRGRP